MITSKIDRHGINTITLNRPEKRNALNLEMINLLIENLIKVNSNKDIRGIIITGSGKSFSAGGDITEMVDRFGKALVTKNRLDLGINRIVEIIRQIKRPVLAVVNGSCFGAGLVIATACDVIYASNTSKFGFSHGSIGLISEGSYFISRYIGLHKAKELIFSRSVLSAEEALKFNFITRVIDKDQLIEFSLTTMKEWVNGPVQTMGLAKEVLNHAFENNLLDHLQFESLAQGTSFTGKEHKEGVKAFLDKRKADFRKI